MREFSVSFREKMRNTDTIIVICTAILISLSVITILGGYVAGGYSKFTSSRVFVQAFSGILGFGLMLTLAFTDYDRYIARFDKIIFAGMIAFLIILLLFGEGDMGNKNWIRVPGIPFNVQPSEFCKPLYIITFSRHIDSLKRSINHPLSILQLGLHAGVVIAMLMLTKDLGTVLVYCAITAFMLFTAGLSVWYFVALAAICVIAFPTVWDMLDTYQQERIKCGFNPGLDPEHYGYQALRSKAAIAQGGLFGSGFAGGKAYKSVPEAQSDFLFAVLGEKFGILGCLIYIITMTVLIIRILYIARKARKNYASTVCVGVAAMLLVQSAENIGMCLAFLPVIGITLPFFSYGGSSVLSSFISVGLVMSIYSHRKKYYFEREDL